jgi:hypothetical protein
MQAPGCCCPSLRQAAWTGHYDCFKILSQSKQMHVSWCRQLVRIIHSAIRRRKVDFARRLLSEADPYYAYEFACDCIRRNDAASLRFTLETCPRGNRSGLFSKAGRAKSVACFHILLEHGTRPCRPFYLYDAARDNSLDFLEAVLRANQEIRPRITGEASGAGNVRFLMRLSEARCPIRVARDGEPAETYPQWRKCIGLFVPHGSDRLEAHEEGSLVVSSDLVRSGPVLLYAAQKGVPLTPRMVQMLGDVRRRAQTLAGCFHRATRLSRGLGPHAREWHAMGGVPIELIQRIATMARISIAVVDLIE